MNRQKPVFDKHTLAVKRSHAFFCTSSKGKCQRESQGMKKNKERPSSDAGPARATTPHSNQRSLAPLMLL